VGTEKLLGVKLEVADDRKVVLDSKLALERIQLDYHHAILVEEATSAELQRLLEADCDAAELDQRLMQVRSSALSPVPFRIEKTRIDVGRLVRASGRMGV
jgi:hypothetical protein